jgi:multisubunit Na+/H+ antiporter MnhE subunit
MNTDNTSLENEIQPSLLGAVMDSTPTVYLMDIDNEATVVIARNIAEAMDKAERISKKDYKMVYSKSLPLLY